MLLPIIALYLLSCSRENSDMYYSDFLLETVFIDNDERLLNYDAVQNVDREACFVEEFDNNVSQFPYEVGVYSDAIVKVEDGKMYIDFYVDSGYIYYEYSPVEIDLNKNFEMETNLLIYNGDSINQTLLFLCNTTETGKFYLINYWKYDYYEKNEMREINNIRIFEKNSKADEWNYIVNAMPEYYARSFLTSGDFATLTVRKIGNKYAIFINHKLFYIINHDNFKYIPGITINHSSNVFDYFRVYYLK
jgi:hypothetical protein